MLLGDVDGALGAAERALELSAESGHFQTRVAAEINLSHVLERKGEFAKAKRHVDRALAMAGGNCHILRAVKDSWANLLITAGDYPQCRRLLDEAELRAKIDGDVRPHWDTITELHSRARLAQAEGRWNDASSILASALAVAESVGDDGWTRRLVNARVRCLAISRDAIEPSYPWMLADSHFGDPQSLAEHDATLAALHASLQQDGAASRRLERAKRIATAMSNVGLCKDLTLGIAVTNSDAPVADTQSASLDSAVALLELAAHPHILGREALALLRGTACTTAAALVSSTPAGVRIVEAVGWNDADVKLAAAKPAADIEHLPVGRRGEESWTLVVRPKRALEPYCVYASIRKLLTIALSLDTYRREEKQRAALWPADALDGDPECIWASEQMTETLSIAKRIAPTPISVLITGETGTGKEMLARAIHRASDRADKLFLPFNCTAVPREMLDSQLFGHRKGAFTGADTSFPGVIRAAAGGTLFLDEIGEIGPAIQPKLLRFLESHEIHPLGEPHPITVDVRIVAATNASVEQLVADGRFREDLFYRLNVVRLMLPPLRERREEIPALVQLYLRKYGDEHKKGRLTLSDETLEYLLLFSWPGNVRQLANEVRRMVALAEPDATLTPLMLSPEIQASRRTIPAGPAIDQEVRVALDQPLPAAVEMLEQLMVRHALDRAHGRVEEASRLLGISRKGLFLKRRRWGLGQAS
ncbi:MAG: sigma 54-interacting transcriptional regulator [Vicinamibacterales bacterium]